MAVPCVLKTALAASIKSAVGKDSLAGTPRVKLIVSMHSFVYWSAEGGH
jgi:hypothetical protein